jgi:flagellar basal body P-ring protein FlgI
MRAWMRAATPLTISIAASLVTLSVVGGCTSLWRKSPEQVEQERLEELLKSPDPPAMIREAASPYGLQYGKVQSFGIINGLIGTGGSEPPSMQRDVILSDLKLRGTENPNGFIDADHTSIVLVETVIPPGARRGDPVDLVVRYTSLTDAKSERTTSLRNGWLMPARLAYTRVIGGQPRTSEPLVVGTGPVIVKGSHESGDDPRALLEGRVIGGGVLQKDSPLDLRIRPEYRHVKIAKLLSDTINRRFYLSDGSGKRGISDAKEDDLISIEVPERYRYNVHRLMAVVGALGTETDLGKTHQRIELLGKLLIEPTTARDASLQLEGIGEEAVPALLVGLGSSNPEIRFYSAEALAYLDHADAVGPLVELTRDQPAFRFQTLLALSGMKSRRAGEGLHQLMNEQSTETRFGAFDALRRRSDRSSWIQGAAMGEIGNYFEIPSHGGQMVAISLRRSPDIVSFGGTVPIQLEGNVMCGTGLVIVPSSNGGLQISRFVPSQPDAQLVVEPTVKGVCYGVMQVGGNFGDVVEVLRVLKSKNAFAAQLAIDVLPQPLREYHRESSQFDEAGLPTSDLPPLPIDPPPAEKEVIPWYNPRGWFSAYDPTRHNVLEC